MEETLRALHRATLVVANRGELDEVLQQIVDVARDLLKAEYAALGVPMRAEVPRVSSGVGFEFF